MNCKNANNSRITIEDFLPGIGKQRMVNTILDGLSVRPRYISSIFFYDVVGSNLFNQITQLPEYYLTKTEMELLEKSACDITQSCNCDWDIVELGSGECKKVCLLLDSFQPHFLHSLRYIPVDINPEEVKRSAQTLVSRYNGLQVHGVIADFMRQFSLIPQERKRLLCLLGSTIGNLTAEMRKAFLKMIANNMKPWDLFLLGMDMVKAPHILEKAYNDSCNITAHFNKNILDSVNSLAQTDFDSSLFEHVAFFNKEKSRIEMHLRASKNMAISSPYLKEKLLITKGELIHTENSYKFTPSQIASEIQSAGLRISFVASDSNEWYSLLLLSKAD